MSIAVPVSWLCLLCGSVETLLFTFGLTALFWPGAQAWAMLCAGLLEPAALAAVVVAAVLLAYARWPAVSQTLPFLSFGRGHEVSNPLCLVLFVALALNLLAIAGMAFMTAIPDTLVAK